MITPNIDAEEEELENEMTDEQLNSFLEIIAKRIEHEAKDAKDASRIVREAKVNS